MDLLVIICIYIYKTLRYVSVQGSAVSGLQEQTEPINTKSVLPHVIRYQVMLAAYYKADTNCCCCRATCLSGHIVDFTTHTSTVCIQYQVLLAAYFKAF
jgi:hypothetical protein